jgi:uncharacterized protein YuzE
LNRGTDSPSIKKSRPMEEKECGDTLKKQINIYALWYSRITRPFTMLSLTGILKKTDMKITYFQDTDTLLVNFNDNEIDHTKDLNENVLVELDKNGAVVSMTIEHAQQQTEIQNFSFNRVENKAV